MASATNEEVSSDPAEGVVITGMAGKFPNSDDIYQFRDNLFDKVDLVSGDHRRWRPIHPEVPQRTGKINDISSFDAGFFGMSHRHVNDMDPMVRLPLERSYEAIVDAGFHPSELAGTNTGVFIGSCFSETEKWTLYVQQNKNGHAMMGTTRSMIAQQISYYFKLQGLSYNTDTACSSSMYALEHAYRSLMEGTCDMAIVGAISFCLHPLASLQFARLGVLSADGLCKVFDNDADGYARSETASVILLQKAKDARRIYAHVVHSKLNSDGFKEQGITYPSSTMQTCLMRETYEECKIDISEVTFLEAHGTGTQVGDPEELNALADVFCTTRERPLFIGGVKSNTGHNEPCAGITSIVKVLIGMESGFIPPNRNFSKPREIVEALVNGRMKVVTEKTLWPDKNVLVGVNCFGFGGSNGHVVLRWNDKAKINDGIPKDDLPRLVCFSGRTEHAVDTISKDLTGRKLDAEFVKLLHTVFGKETPNHPYRGYQILSKTGDLARSAKRAEIGKRKLVLILNNFDKTWARVGKKLISFPIFEETLGKIQGTVAKGINVDLTDLVRTFDKEDAMNQILATMAVQLCLVEILKRVGVNPDTVIGLGTGELIAAYFEEQLSLGELVLANVFVGFAFCKETTRRIDSSNSFVYEELLKNLKDLVVAKTASAYKRWVPLYRGKKVHKQGSAEYLVQNVTSPFVFDEVKQFVPVDSDILVIGANIEGLRGLGCDDSVFDLLSHLGSLYENGHQLRLDHLYPKVAWPVSRGTPMISPLVKWIDKQNWYMAMYRNEHEITTGQRVVHVITREHEWAFVTGHVVDGRNLFPATGYLQLVWETLAMMMGKLASDMRVVFEDVKFLRAVNLTNQEDVEIIVAVQTGEKKFEITEGGAVVVTGTVYEHDDSDQEVLDFYVPAADSAEGLSTLQHKDIYKELRIRGYNYKGAFRGLNECDIGGNKGSITWTGNWIPFMDNMLQMIILRMDTKMLYVPTGIKQVIIDAPKHIELSSKLGQKETTVPIYSYPDLGIVRSGGIEFRGLKANVIARRKSPLPVLETYRFIPNVTALPLSESMRVMIQVVLENSITNNVKSVEVPGESETLSLHIKQALGDLPMIQAETVVLSKVPLDLPGVTVEDRKLSLETNTLIVIATNLFGQPVTLNEALNAIKDSNGYIISRENVNIDSSVSTHYGLNVLCVHNRDHESLVLLRKSTEYKQPIVIDVSNDLNWIPTVQNALKDGRNLILYSQYKFSDGILGLVNCLRREPNGARISCFFIIDDGPKFDLEDSFYKEQASKNLAFNVWKDGSWGMYRHLLLEDNPIVECEHCFANVTVRGDLSSMKFIQGRLDKDFRADPGLHMVYVYYCSLNFRDIMTASGRLSVDLITTDRKEQECVQGFEFAGRDKYGNRVMGMSNTGALASHIIADPELTWNVLDEWSLEDAATIPVVYGTVTYAFLMRAKLKRGQSVLIHSATGGVGQAAINIALFYECEIFVTVGSQEKRDFVRNTYPQIPDTHIGNSRDTSFEEMIRVRTNGRGVDVVLNSLAEEKLLASVRCVARGGHFCEIGKFDIASDNELEMELFERGAHFNGVMLDTLFVGNPALKQTIYQTVVDLMHAGAIKPLPRTIFQREQVSDAFKYMSSGKHMGKVIVKMREEEQEKLSSIKQQLFKALPRYYCESEGSYVILGGLGGFGLQLADWLLLRGARKLILVSRTGVKTGYQAMMLRLWRRSYGTTVTIRTDDVTTEEGCVELMRYCNSLGPVHAIFNLAVVLKDALFENQTVETYQISLAPKAVATQLLDVITREMCPQLSQFVVFSSVSCGRGNAGQTNYGMANSVMERICERRKSQGYPGLAIQWGAIGDVGLVAEMSGTDSELVIGGTLQQRIANCLEVLDVFLRQDEVIVGSMIVAEKRSASTSANNIVDAVLNIMGINDLKKVSLHSSFPELGIDSIMGLEVKQTLEREFDVLLSAQDIRTMTFAKLQEIAAGKMADEQGTVETVVEHNEDLSADIKLLLHHVGDEETSHELIVQIGDFIEESVGTKVYILPGIEGTATLMRPLIKNLNRNVTCLQYCSEVNTVEEWAQSFLPYIDTTMKHFVLIAHSAGCVVATEIAYLLEQTGCSGKLILIDGAPVLFPKLIRRRLDISSDATFQTSVICALMSRYLPLQTILTYKYEILQCATFEERIKFGISISPNIERSTEYITNICWQAYLRLRALEKYSPKFSKLKSAAILMKPESSAFLDEADDYELSTLYETLNVGQFPGDHLTILENPEVAHAINEFITSGDAHVKTAPVENIITPLDVEELKQI